ncbi:MAG: tRNA uridine-5-carboxymethylaminomethyl(34) synthesis GTPase MnmE [Rikenellaceae bacterium]
MIHSEEIIVAPATLCGGAIAIVRLSGEGSVELVDGLFRGVNGGGLTEARGYTLHYGDVVDGDEVVDDVMISIFRNPHSYTGEDSVEISCHGSSYIVSRIIELALARGARMAREGEFTIRAFMAGRIDLSQAEAVADMIASSNRAMHALATTQMRGGYSAMLNEMRSKLVHLSSLIELELDFSEEDVEFADRGELVSLMDRLKVEIERLRNSFQVGNAIKEGVGVAIVGAPNAGKSTLLNRILGEDRAMVSEIAGTTRDTIEDVVVVDGIKFRFIDTAGIHSSDDRLEQMGIERTYDAMSKVNIVLQIVDILELVNGGRVESIPVSQGQKHIVVLNKIDNIEDSSVVGDVVKLLSFDCVVTISARGGVGVDNLLRELKESVDLTGLYEGDAIVSNARHYNHLSEALKALENAQSAIQQALSTDLLAEDLRHTLHHIGSITGEITNDEILGTIFSSFCIGK